MNTALLPTHVSPSMASALTGLSSRLIRRMLRAGLLPSEGDSWQRIALAAVEELIGKPITAEMYLAADRQLDRARAKQAAYNHTRNLSPRAKDKDFSTRPVTSRGGTTERLRSCAATPDGNRAPT